MGGIFLSYRRGDSQKDTDRISDWLIREFGKRSIFQDVDKVPAGVDFRNHIRSVIKRSDIEVVIIGPQWITIREESGNPRIESHDDPVRIEVETALENNIPIIPLLVSGAEMPPELRLPGSIAELANINAVVVRDNPYFASDIRKVIAAIRMQRLTVARRIRARGNQLLARYSRLVQISPAAILLAAAVVLLAAAVMRLLTNTQYLGLSRAVSTIQLWQIVAVGVFVLALIIYILVLSATKVEDGRVTATMITELEKMSAPVLLALENSAGEGADADRLIQQLIKLAILRIRSSYGGRVFRGSVWVPDPDDPANWLRLLAHIGLDHIAQSRRFYIGSDPDNVTNRRGVAGTAFYRRTPLLTHYDNSRGRADNPNFIGFTSDVKRVYSSFVAVPLSASFLNLDQGTQSARNDNNVYGVICLDSAFRNTFNNDPITDQEGKRLLTIGPLLRIIYQLLRWHSRLRVVE